MPTSPTSPATITFRSCRRRTTAAPTGSPASAPGRSSSNPGSRACAPNSSAIPNYYKEGLPYFDEVEFLSITDVAARINALTTGEVHWIGRPDLKTLNLLERNPDIAITEVTGYGHYTLPMNVTWPPFDNADVRHGAQMGDQPRGDRHRRSSSAMPPPGNDNPIAPVVKFAIDPQPKHAYDPDKAKFHLKKAGLSSLKVDLSVADAAFNGAVDAAVLYPGAAPRRRASTSTSSASRMTAIGTMSG